jgi:hypothetical protein
MKKLFGLALVAGLLASTANEALAYYVVQQPPSHVVVVPGPQVVIPVPASTPCGTGSLRGTPWACITNATSFPIISLFARSSGITGMFTNGINLLAQTNYTPPGQPLRVGPINPGESRLVHIQDGGNFCTYNVHITTAVGLQHDYYNLNVCDISNIVLRGW